MKHFVELSGGLVAVLHYNLAEAMSSSRLAELVKQGGEGGNPAVFIERYKVGEVEILQPSYSPCSLSLTRYDLDKIYSAIGELEAKRIEHNAQYELDNFEY